MKTCCGLLDKPEDYFFLLDFETQNQIIRTRASTALLRTNETNLKVLMFDFQ